MRNLPHKVTGDDLTADEFNDIPEEEENLITSTGQALSAGDLRQIAKAVATYAAVGDFYGDSGSGNAYVLAPLSSFLAPVQYWDGMRVRFRISHTNTGPATITVNSLGVKDIVKEDGITPLGAGDLPIGEHGELIFHADIDKFELYSHKYNDQSFGTADHIWTDATGARAGWIWINDSTKTTIGNASSLATIRANVDCQALFTRYWAFNVIDCPMYTSAGVLIPTRGVSAAADWAANNRMAIPDSFRKAFAAYDISDPTAKRIGEVEGAKTHTGSIPELVGHSHSYMTVNSTEPKGGSGGSPPFTTIQYPNTGSTGGGLPYSIMQPTVYKTLYIKL